jgi:aconitate hydratase
MEMIARSGALGAYISAGARLLESACGPCIGQGAAPAEGTVSVRTFNRNFEGRSGTRSDDVILASPEVAVAAALTGVVTDPRTLGIDYPVVQDPATFVIDDSMIIAPPAADAPKPEIRRASTIGAPPHNEPLPAAIGGTVLAKVGDKITTDHIMPAGPFLKLRSNIPEYARAVFFCYNETNKPTFADRALELKQAGGHGIIVAGESYGQGSSREHAAICPMYLGVKAVIAKSMERIHRDNLINFGIVPLLFVDPDDYEKLSVNDRIEIENIREQLQAGPRIRATLADGATIELEHGLTEREASFILAGGRLNLFD